MEKDEVIVCFHFDILLSLMKPQSVFRAVLNTPLNHGELESPGGVL